MFDNPAFRSLSLDDANTAFLGEIPVDLIPTEIAFDRLWDLHPEQSPVIAMHGKRIAIPRWQRAFGRDYRFSGLTSPALPIPAELNQFLIWSKRTINPALNGLLLNWYDGAKGHYIGKHRDSRKGLVTGAPIVTISLGEERPFRFQKWRSTERVDIAAQNGSVIIIPDHVNQSWTHAVPKTVRAKGRRVSITLRAFDDGDPQ